MSNAQPRLTLSVHETVESEDIIVAERRPDYLSAINSCEIVKIEEQIEVKLTSPNSYKIGLFEDASSLETRKVSRQR